MLPAQMGSQIVISVVGFLILASSTARQEVTLGTDVLRNVDVALLGMVPREMSLVLVISTKTGTRFAQGTHYGLLQWARVRSA